MRWPIPCVLWSLAVSSALHAETILLKNGRLLHGEVVNQNQMQVFFRPPGKAVIVIAKSSIARISYSDAGEEERKKQQEMEEAEKRRLTELQKQKDEEDRARAQEEEKKEQRARETEKEEAERVKREAAERSRLEAQKRQEEAARQERERLDRSTGILILTGGQRLPVHVLTRRPGQISVQTNLGTMAFREEDVRSLEYTDSTTNEKRYVEFSGIGSRKPAAIGPPPSDDVTFPDGEWIRGSFQAGDGLFYRIETAQGNLLFERSQLARTDVPITIPPGPEPETGEDGIFVLNTGTAVHGRVLAFDAYQFIIAAPSGRLTLQKTDLAYARKDNTPR